LKKIKAVIIYYRSKSVRINGSLVDNFEYFYTLWESDKSIQFLFVNATKSIMYNIKLFLSNRYNIDLDCFKNIKSISIFEFISTKFTIVYTSDLLTMQFFNETLVQSKNKYFITELNNPEYIVKNGIYYSEMKDNRIKDDIEYRTKMRFDLLKKPKIQNKVLYVNAPMSKDPFTEIINNIKHKYNLIETLKKTNTNFENIFEKFSHYLYIKTLEYNDPRPRMFHECYYLNIPYEYYNTNNIKDGSWYRYWELQKNGLEGRFLTKDDEIIQRILND